MSPVWWVGPWSSERTHTGRAGPWAVPLVVLGDTEARRGQPCPRTHGCCERPGCGRDEPPLARFLWHLQLRWGPPAGRDRAEHTAGDTLEIQAMGGHHSTQPRPLSSEGRFWKKEVWPRGQEGLQASCFSALHPDVFCRRQAFSVPPTPSTPPARVWRSSGTTVEGETPGLGPSPQIRSRHRGPDSAAGNTLAIKSKSPERKGRLHNTSFPAAPSGPVDTPALPWLSLARSQPPGSQVSGGDAAAGARPAPPWEGDLGQPAGPLSSHGVIAPSGAG